MNNISEWVDLGAENWGERTAIISGTDSLTYTKLYDATNQFAAACRSLGIQVGERVVLHTSNRWETVVALLAICRIGAVAICIHPQTPLAQLHYILHDSQASMLITKQRLAMDTNSIQHCRVFIALEDSEEVEESSSQWLNYRQCLLQHRGAEVPARFAIHQGAVFIYTSGSTGKPKAIISTHENIMFSSKAINAYLSHTKHDTVLSFLPLSFDYGLYQIFLTLSRGAQLLLGQLESDALQLGRLIEGFNVTGLPGLRAIFHVLVKYSGKSFPGVRYITNTGDFLPETLIDQVKLALPNARLFLMYGLSECKRVSYLPPEYLETKSNSVGIPLEGTTATVYDEEGRECPPMVCGELIVRGNHVCQGYWNDSVKTEHTFYRNGEKELRTGDIFYKDHEGFLYYVGRKDDMVKAKGYRIDPYEIENVLSANVPEIDSIIAVAVSDKLHGNVIGVYVVSDGLLDSEKLRYKIRMAGEQWLEPWKVPHYIIFGDVLPFKLNGKIDRRKIAELVEQKSLPSNKETKQ